MFGIPHHLPRPAPPPTAGPATGDKPPAPAQSHRTKYVVLGVTSERTSSSSSEQEMLWTLRLRRADHSVPPAYIYRVAQKPGTAAPAATNAVLEIDPRLVDVERDG